MELKKLTTFHLGGKPKYFYLVKDRESLASLMIKLRRKKVPYYILGGGSNLLVSDQGVKGAVIKLAGDFRKMSFNGAWLTAGAAVSPAQILAFSRQHDLTGAEFLLGLPGTIGGAVKMNAGPRGFGLADIIKQVEVMSGAGVIRVLAKKKIGFSYRDSGIVDGNIILSVELALQKSSKNVISKKLDLYREQRKNQPWGFSAGCIFKNPPGRSAGALIDAAGFKGKRIGRARVSSIHANFIINDKGQARAREVWELVKIIRAGVKKKFGVKLEPEIKLWGDFK